MNADKILFFVLACGLLNAVRLIRSGEPTSPRDAFIASAIICLFCLGLEVWING